MRRLIDDVYLFWALLALPALWFLAERFVLNGRVDDVPWTGVVSAWLLIAAMAVTPLQLVFGALPWLRRRRRYIGVASFGYAGLHMVFWAIDARIGEIIRSFLYVDMLTGWVAMAVMTVLAATSYDGAVRALGPMWKTIQRGVYPAAVLTLIHWVMTADRLADVILYTAPLAVLSAWRIWRHQSRPRGA